MGGSLFLFDYGLHYVNDVEVQSIHVYCRTAPDTWDSDDGANGFTGHRRQ